MKICEIIIYPVFCWIFCALWLKMQQNTLTYILKCTLCCKVIVESGIERAKKMVVLTVTIVKNIENGATWVMLQRTEPEFISTNIHRSR